MKILLSALLLLFLDSAQACLWEYGTTINGKRILLDEEVAIARHSRDGVKESLFKEYEKENPGSYKHAANLGTAYELTGDLENALHWIGEGVKLNPNAHQGSEWLHVKILEAEIALKANPDWLRGNSVLGENFGSNFKPTLTTGSKTASELSDSIQYQLKERLQFAKAPNEIVGALLFAL